MTCPISILCSCFFFIAFGQTNLKIQTGTMLKVTGDVDVDLENTAFSNDSSLFATNGEVHFTGNVTGSAVNGKTSTTFHKVVVNETANEVTFGSSRYR